MGPFSFPVRILASGLRRGNTPLTVAGGLLFVWAFMRRLDGSRRELVYRETVKAGSAVMVGVLRAWQRGGQRIR